MRRLYLLCGESMSGKTALRREMERLLHVVPIAFDEINVHRGMHFGLPGHPEEAWTATLELALSSLRQLMLAGRQIVVDDTLCYRWLRDRFRDLAAEYRYTCVLLHLMVDESVLRERFAIAKRMGTRPVLSDAAFSHHLLTFETPTEEEQPTRLATPHAAADWLVRECTRRHDLPDSH